MTTPCKRLLRWRRRSPGCHRYRQHGHEDWTIRLAIAVSTHLWWMDLIFFWNHRTCLTPGPSASSAPCTARCWRPCCRRTSGPPMRRTGRREGWKPFENNTSTCSSATLGTWLPTLPKWRQRRQRGRRGETKVSIFYSSCLLFNSTWFAGPTRCR